MTTVERGEELVVPSRQTLVFEVQVKDQTQGGFYGLLNGDVVPDGHVTDEKVVSRRPLGRDVSHPDHPHPAPSLGHEP